ncbi:MAG: polyribonucleotide nucleotidyltransferase [Deltaproteobacteria bacterium]|nr:polyribonucleotide nucleotidyltransferase [Deltaproteobacteria bacterium]
MSIKLTTEVGGQALGLETGAIARQANGAVVVSYGDTMVLVTAVSSGLPREGIDFFPLTVDYLEKTSSAGKIPGGFFKREGRLTEKETLTSRFIDRPLRPLFPEGFRNETQIIATVLSSDPECDADVLAITGASAALTISDIPFQGPIAGVRVGRINGELIANPTNSQVADCDLNIILAASEDAIVMVEGGGKEILESDIVEALLFGHEAIRPLIAIQKELRAAVEKTRLAEGLSIEKIAFVAPVTHQRMERVLSGEAAGDEAASAHLEEFKRFKDLVAPKLTEAYSVTEKQKRREQIRAARDEMTEAFVAPEKARQRSLGSPAELETAAREIRALEARLKSWFHDLEGHIVRMRILKDKTRIDGRGLGDVRAIECQVGILPRAHGSALFTRGETQALVMTTLGTSDDEQLIETLTGEHWRTFLLHYNFPPFSTGETKFLRGPGRREIGHGALADRALRGQLPEAVKFPYTIRVVGEVLESNGSSSMATVCGGSLSLMDAGVPINAPVAGIAMGLIKEGSDVAVLTDILGDEDHLGDMDFKVTGTSVGVTALQMDIKIDEGVSREVMAQALDQARVARLHVLERMNAALSAPRPELSPHAPRIETVWIKPDRIRDVIGPGGKVIKGIQSRTGAKIDVDDSGEVRVASADLKALEQAKAMIRELTQEAEIGRVYLGKVRKIMDFGAFVEIFPGTDGLVHISELAHKRVDKVTDVLREGDEVMVKCLDVDPQGKIRLSRKAALGDLDDEAQGEAEKGGKKDSEDSSPRDDGGRSHRRRR